MITGISLLLALAAAPVQDAHGSTAPAAGAPAAQAEQVDPHGTAPRVETPAASHAEQAAVEVMGDTHAAEAGHGDEVDFMHHIQDSREWETPFGVVHFPEPHSWQVGPVDMTPTKHVLFLWIAAAITLLVLLGGASLAGRAGRGVTAGKRHNLIEAMVLYIRNEVVMPNIGHGGEKFAPFVITLFFFILFANLLGLIPYGSTATANISVTAALAFLTFLVVEISGMRKLGAHYLSTIFFVPKGMNPVAAWAMAIALAPIELMGKFIRPIALAIRLMANMTAGHIVLLAIISLIFVFGSWAIVPAPLFMAVAIFFLEIFVAFLQAFIFAMLTSVFIGLIQHAH